MEADLKKRLNDLPTHCLAGVISAMMSEATSLIDDAFGKLTKDSGNQKSIFGFLARETSYVLEVFLQKVKLKNPSGDILEDEAFKEQLGIYQKLQDEYWDKKCKVGTVLSFLGYSWITFEVLGVYNELNKPVSEQVLVCRGRELNSGYLFLIPKQIEALLFISTKKSIYEKLLMKAPNHGPLKLPKTKENDIWESGKVFFYSGYPPLHGNWETLFVLAHRGEPNNLVVIARKQKKKGTVSEGITLSEFTPDDLPKIKTLNEPRQYVKRLNVKTVVLFLQTSWIT